MCFKEILLITFPFFILDLWNGIRIIRGIDGAVILNVIVPLFVFQYFFYSNICSFGGGRVMTFLSV